VALGAERTHTVTSRMPDLDVAPAVAVLRADRRALGAGTGPSRGSVGRRLEGLWEAVLLGTLYLAYERVASIATGRQADAYHNAWLIHSWEHTVHLDVELSLNLAFTPHQALADVVSLYYQLAHETVALVALIALWRYRRPMYRALRDALVAVTMVAVIMYWLIPVAPPRMALPGTVDTVSARPGVFATQGPIAGLVNLYAAMPSLHVAWATWCALALVVTTRSRWRHLAWLYPLTTTAVVLVTANHYVLDVVVGALLTFGSWYATTRVVPGIRAGVVAGLPPAWQRTYRQTYRHGYRRLWSRTLRRRWPEAWRQVSQQTRQRLGEARSRRTSPPRHAASRFAAPSEGSDQEASREPAA
jgi:PAP2 superfamily